MMTRTLDLARVADALYERHPEIEPSDLDDETVESFLAGLRLLPPSKRAIALIRRAWDVRRGAPPQADWQWEL